MKKLVLALFVFGLTLGAYAAREGESVISIGLASFPYKLNSDSTIVVSDIAIAGANFGEIELDLSKGSIDTDHLYGVLLGYEGYVTDNIGVIFEGQLGVYDSKATGLTLNIAGSFALGVGVGTTLGDALTIEGVGKIGYMFGVISFGEVFTKTTSITAYVNTDAGLDPEKRITDGDSMSASIGGLMLQLGAKANLDLGGTGLFIESGVTSAFLRFVGVSATRQSDKDTIKVPDTQIFKADGTTQADLDKIATGASLGYYLNFGLSFRL